jgi:hypothetical protein
MSRSRVPSSMGILRLKSPGTPNTCSMPRDASLFHKYTPNGTVELAMVVNVSVDVENGGVQKVGCGVGVILGRFGIHLVAGDVSKFNRKRDCST